jgi:hypothetical protein
VSVLLDNGDGTFGPLRAFPTGCHPNSVVVTDFNGDGIPDIVSSGITDAPYHDVLSVLLGKGDGTFGPPQLLPIDGPYALLADLNGDGKPDIVTASNPDYSNRTGSVLLAKGDGSFTQVSPSSGVALRNTPYMADLTGDSLSDSVVLDRSGNILFRKGLSGPDSPFAPPVVLNPGRPARDLTVVKTGSGWAVAAADSRFTSAPSGPNHSVATVSLYTVSPNGTVRRSTAFTSTLLPTHITAADLTGTGLDDLIVANSLDNSIQVAFQQPNGTFSAPITLTTGETPSDITVADPTSTATACSTSLSPTKSAATSVSSSLIPTTPSRVTASALAAVPTYWTAPRLAWLSPTWGSP